MKHVLFLSILGLCFCSCNNQKSRSNNDDTLTMVVGTYTNGSSKGIYTYKFNQLNGTSSYLNEIDTPNPSYLTISGDNKYVYAVNELNDSTASVSSFQFEKESGKLTFLNKIKTQGEDPCYIINYDKTILTANYSGGSMSIFSIGDDGGINKREAVYRGSIGGTDTIRQNTPHIHCVQLSPDGKFVYGTDFSADQIIRFDIPEKGALPIETKYAAKIESGSGPRHMIFSKDGKFAYVMSELSGKVTIFSYSDGRLQEIQSVVSDSLNGRGGADIHLSPDGKFLYSSNRLISDGISIFRVDAENGKLTKIGYQLTGIHPRNFNITPNGRFLLVACRDSNKIQVFERDLSTGLLKDTHQDIIIDRPVCIQFAQ